MIRKILALINQIPIKERRRLDGLTFIVEKDMFQIVNGGMFAKAQYFKNNSLVFYEAMINNDKELKEVLRHELCHHFGMDERQVKDYFKSRER